MRNSSGNERFDHVHLLQLDENSALFRHNLDCGRSFLLRSCSGTVRFPCLKRNKRAYLDDAARIFRPVHHALCRLRSDDRFFHMDFCKAQGRIPNKRAGHNTLSFPHSASFVILHDRGRRHHRFFPLQVLRNPGHDEPDQKIHGKLRPPAIFTARILHPWADSHIIFGQASCDFFRIRNLLSCTEIS